MTKRTSVACRLLVLLLPIAAAAHGEQPTVKVSFELAEPIYRNEYSDDEQKSLGDNVAGAITKRLNDEIRFLRFVKDGAATYQLNFRLGDPAASTVQFHDVFFHIALRGPNLSDARTTWLFRGNSLWGLSSGDPDTFLNEITTALKAHRFDELVEPLFSKVSVATGGRFMRPPMRWVLPFRRLDFCMDMQSRVRLKTKIPIDGAPIELDYLVFAAGDFTSTDQGLADWRQKLFCLPVGVDGADVLQNSDPASVQIDGVFVAKYLRMDDCGEPLPPDAALASAGGGQ